MDVDIDVARVFLDCLGQLGDPGVTDVLQDSIQTLNELAITQRNGAIPTAGRGRWRLHVLARFFKNGSLARVELETVAHEHR